MSRVRLHPLTSREADAQLAFKSALSRELKQALRRRRMTLHRLFNRNDDGVTLRMLGRICATIGATLTVELTTSPDAERAPAATDTCSHDATVELMNVIADDLREVLARRGVGVTRLLRETGASRRMLSRLLNKRDSGVRLVSLSRLCTAMGATLTVKLQKAIADDTAVDTLKRNSRVLPLPK